MKKKIFIKKSDAIAYFGSVGEISRRLNIKSQAVSQWGEYVPEKSAWPMYYMTNGKLRADVRL